MKSVAHHHVAPPPRPRRILGAAAAVAFVASAAVLLASGLMAVGNQLSGEPQFFAAREPSVVGTAAVVVALGAIWAVARAFVHPGQRRGRGA